jgi:hypothetical protein
LHPHAGLAQMQSLKGAEVDAKRVLRGSAGVIAIAGREDLMQTTTPGLAISREYSAGKSRTGVEDRAVREVLKDP